MDRGGCFDAPYASGGDKDPISFPPIDHLRISGDDGHLCLPCSLGNRLHHLSQGFHRQAFLQNKAEAEVEGTCPRHR